MKILIVDDEALARDRLRQLLEEGNQHVVVGDAANGQQALEMSGTLDPDVVLLDIRMPGLSGLEIAQHLNAFEKPPAVVFTTAYDEYAIEAFDAQAVGYILKPVRRERLAQALERAGRLNAATISAVGEQAGIENRRNHVCARVRGELRLIPVEDIRYFSADQKYTCVSHTAGKHLIDDSLKQLEQEFSDNFVRVHRSALVAVSRIEALEKSADGQVSIRLREDGQPEEDRLIISRRHLAEVRRRLKGRVD
ncbi:MAG: response regulator transcription factor [Gammaproteobacteria bacterium]|nr:response regulator transcription factor [Gammaproteobacteria bacterium]